ncbi:MAG: cytochrome c nitrite reductase small subunit [Bacteroidota bacterium]
MEKKGLINQNWFMKIITHLIPPLQWRFPVIVLFGIFAGLGFYLLHISNAVSYLSDDPKMCVNCHVMNPQYATWERGSHGRSVTCNDCHVPQNNFISKYLFKANDGLRHAAYFTLRWEPQVIRIKEDGKRAVQDNCIRCHSTGGASK